MLLRMLRVCRERSTMSSAPCVLILTSWRVRSWSCFTASWPSLSRAFCRSWLTFTIRPFLSTSSLNSFSILARSAAISAWSMSRFLAKVSSPSAAIFCWISASISASLSCMASAPWTLTAIRPLLAFKASAICLSVCDSQMWSMSSEVFWNTPSMFLAVSSAITLAWEKWPVVTASIPAAKPLNPSNMAAKTPAMLEPRDSTTFRRLVNCRMTKATAGPRASPMVREKSSKAALVWLASLVKDCSFSAAPPKVRWRLSMADWAVRAPPVKAPSSLLAILSPRSLPAIRSMRSCSDSCRFFPVWTEMSIASLDARMAVARLPVARTNRSREEMAWSLSNRVAAWMASDHRTIWSLFLSKDRPAASTSPFRRRMASACSLDLRTALEKKAMMPPVVANGRNCLRRPAASPFSPEKDPWACLAFSETPWNLAPRTSSAPVSELTLTESWMTLSATSAHLDLYGLHKGAEQRGAAPAAPARRRPTPTAPGAATSRRSSGRWRTCGWRCACACDGAKGPRPWSRRSPATTGTSTSPRSRPSS